MDDESGSGIKSISYATLRYVGTYINAAAAAMIAQTITSPLSYSQYILDNQTLLMVKEGKIRREYNSNWDCIKDTLKHDYKVLWKGNVHHMVVSSGVEGWNFLLKEMIRRYLGAHQISPYHQPNAFMIINYTAGAFAGFWHTLITYPTYIARMKATSMIMDAKERGKPPPFPNANIGYRKVIRQEGMNHLYGGVDGPLFINTLHRSIYFGTFDSIRPFWIRDNERNFFRAFAIGLFSASISSLACYPLEYVHSGVREENERFFAALRRAIRTNGISSLLYGNIDNMIKSAPKGALILAIFHYFQVLIWQ